MKQTCGIVVLLTISSACLALPTKSAEQERAKEYNDTKLEPHLIAIQNISDQPTIEVEAAEIAVLPNDSTSPQKSENKVILKDKDEDHKFKDSPQNEEEIKRQSEAWKGFEDDFSLLEDRMPDLTDEEYSEINKEGAIPFNFLKTLVGKQTAYEVKPRAVQAFTPIYITVPIVINTQTSSLPISMAIGGQQIPLNIPSETKIPSSIPNNVKTPATGSVITTTSNFNKLMDYNEPPRRQTNRHRSNYRKKINALNNNLQVEEFEYKK